ncbi:zona pellucida sperm-binding protein 3 [Colossoma macropomum]|uniref:zona pellucida sperm-binding protein 3 n=1 Tax=Colossoma macropomum TaxID=42526 RepID=UPI0018643F20|nr:zona pellucida sperm-binding protein 3 [Colossoma macropomum]
MINMFLKAALILVILTYKVDLHPFTKTGKMLGAEKSWIGEKKAAAPMWKGSAYYPVLPPSLNLPESQRILASDINKDLFRPERNRRPVPDLMKSILLPPTSPPKTSSATSASRPVDMLCHLDRIYVRVLKSLFNNPNAWQYLKVGTCAVNQATDTHYYFLYYLDSCNVKRQENENEVIYSNTLRYEPESTELVARELPFSVSLECHYSKHHRSYQVGFMPQVAAETILWRLETGLSLTPVDVSWKPLASGRSYVIGQPVYFEAKALWIQKGKRLYLNNCYISSSAIDSMPKHTVLNNYGCMIESKKSAQTKFHVSDENNTLRFSVGALVFKDMMSQSAANKVMFIHCEMALGPEKPTPSSKSCWYNVDTKRWSELYGDDSVCACCDTSCPAPEPSVPMTPVTSNPWELDRLDQPGLEAILPEENMDMFELYGFRK